MPGKGRPSKYKPEYARQAAKLYASGMTDEEVADFYDVNTSTVYEWANKKADFSNARKQAKEFADSKVEQSLYARANGCSVPEEKVFCVQGEFYTHMTEKHFPPDTTSCIFWLKNRKPDAWRDLKNVDIQILTDDERMDRIDALLQGALDREVDELTKH